MAKNKNSIQSIINEKRVRIAIWASTMNLLVLFLALRTANYPLRDIIETFAVFIGVAIITARFFDDKSLDKNQNLFILGISISLVYNVGLMMLGQISPTTTQIIGGAVQMGLATIITGMVIKK